MSELEYHRFKHPNMFILEYKRAHVVAPEYRIKKIKEKTELSVLDLSSHLDQPPRLVRNKSFNGFQSVKCNGKQENQKKVRFPVASTLSYIPMPRIVLKKLAVKKSSITELKNPFPMLRNKFRFILK